MIPGEVSAVLARCVPRPALFQLLSSAGRGRVTLVSAPAGSGKTMLLRSWIAETGLHDRAAWVSVERGERDAQRFWLSVIEGLRTAVGTDAFVEKLAPAPDFDGAAVVARLVSELGSLEEPVALVVDDLHELASAEALTQLQFLLARLPNLLHVVLATRHDPHQLGLHRLRLDGELTEVRASDLRFTLAETRALLAGSGIALTEESIGLLHTRTEGWAAGLRLAAISLAGHPDPERFVAEFSGSERTVADYLLAEVLARQSDDVRRLLLSTSVLERVNGALADVLVGTSGSERILVALEDANAFVVSLDANRAWFRYHHLFADFLRLELRRSDPGAPAALHRAAARWHAQNGDVVDAVRHAQAGLDWGYAARLLVDNSYSLSLDGREATVGGLLVAFPRDIASDPELAAVFATDEVARGSLDHAAKYIALAQRSISLVSNERRDRFEVALGVARLSLARRRGDVGSALDAVQPLLGPPETQTLSDLTLDDDIRAVALMNLGIVELWAFRIEDAVRHLEQGITLARKIRRPYVEIACLSAIAPISDSFDVASQRCDTAIAIAEEHGWGAEPILGVALVTKGGVDVWQGRFDEAEGWLHRAEQTLRPELEPATALLLHLTRGMLCVGHGRLEQALVELRAAERLQTELVAPHGWTVQTRQFLVNVHVRLGDTRVARSTLAGISDEDRAWGEARVALASVHLADGEAEAALGVLAPVVARSAPVIRDFTVIHAFLLDAVAHDLLGDTQAAESDIESALELAEPEAVILPFVMAAPRELLERHPRHRTAHGALLQGVLEVLAGSSLPHHAAERSPLREALSHSEQRVLRFLPSNLSAPEIGNELYLSLNTIKTHMRGIYAKLGVHRRTEAVERARELGLLGPSRRHR